MLQSISFRSSELLEIRPADLRHFEVNNVTDLAFDRLEWKRKDIILKTKRTRYSKIILQRIFEQTKSARRIARCFRCCIYGLQPAVFISRIAKKVDNHVGMRLSTVTKKENSSEYGRQSLCCLHVRVTCREYKYPGRDR